MNPHHLRSQGSTGVSPSNIYITTTKKAVQRHPNAFKTFSKKAKEIVSDLSD